MPKNSQELIQIAGQWANTVKNDIRTQMINFIEESQLTEEQVAEMFTMTMGELDQILHGNGECTVTTLTKLLIITGNTLEIKPIEQSPLGDYENVNPHVQQPQSAQRTPSRPAPQQMPPSRWGVDSKGRPLPDPEELFGAGHVPMHEPSQAEMDRLLDEYWERKAPHTAPAMPQQRRTPMPPVTPAHHMPMRDAHGRFIKKGATPTPAPVESAPRPTAAPHGRFDSMSRPELVHLIEENLWDTEINTQTATIGALRDFLSAKEARLHQRRNPQPTPEPAQPKGNEDIANFASAMRSFVEQNPQLRDAMKSIFG